MFKVGVALLRCIPTERQMDPGLKPGSLACNANALPAELPGR